MKMFITLLSIAWSLSPLNAQAGMSCSQVLDGGAVSFKVGVFGKQIQGIVDTAPIYNMTGPDNVGKLKLEMVIIPSDKIGRQLIVKRYDESRPFQEFWKLVLTYPKAYAARGIFADQNRFVVPNDVRFNALNPNGLQLRHLPANVPQLYSNSFFVKSMRQKIEPKATQGQLFEHDHFQEHWAGALSAPPWVFNKLMEFSEFHGQLSRIVKESNSSPEYQELVSKEDSAALWDSFTNNLGSAVIDLAETPGVVTAKNILRIRRVLINYNFVFSGSISEQVLNPQDLYSEKLTQADYHIYGVHKLSGLNEEKALPLESQIRALQKQVMTPPLSPDLITADAIQIVHEITGIPVDKLRDILGNVEE
jgi:hypothetical protein